MTDSTGEDSPAPERETVPASQDDVGGHCSTGDCIRPIIDDVLLPVVGDDKEPDVDESLRVDGETFEERMARYEASSGQVEPRARQMLYSEFVEVALKQREEAAAEEGYHDDDGAVWFEQGGEPQVLLRLPRGVPVPSAEMVRRHRAAGLRHCPYRSLCEDCVRGACNAPAHRARDPKPNW